MGVPLVAANLVDGALAHAHDMKRVKGTLTGPATTRRASSRTPRSTPRRRAYRAFSYRAFWVRCTGRADLGSANWRALRRCTLLRSVRGVIEHSSNISGPSLGVLLSAGARSPGALLGHRALGGLEDAGAVGVNGLGAVVLDGVGSHRASPRSRPGLLRGRRTARGLAARRARASGRTPRGVHSAGRSPVRSWAVASQVARQRWRFSPSLVLAAVFAADQNAP